MRAGQTYAWFPDGEVRALVPDGGFWFQACVHPKGDHVVSWGGTRGLPRMWRTDLDAPPRSAEAFGPQGARQPSYGLQGDRLVFAAEPAPAERLEDTFAEVASGMPLPGTVLDIWTCGPDGRDLEQVTDGPHHDERPCLSPDGTTVA